MRHALPAALATALVAASSSPASAGDSYDTCKGFIDSLPATITTPGIWCLNKNLATSMTAGQAIVIGTSNVTLDCNGFKINGLTGGNASLAIGVYADGRLNTTIRGCNIRGFSQGIYLFGSDGSTIEDVVSENATERGIHVVGDRGSIRRNRVVDVGGSPVGPWAIGITLHGEGEIVDNSVAGVVANAVIGVYSLHGNGAVVERNRITDVYSDISGASYGINVAGVLPAIVRGNSVIGDVQLGIQCAHGSQVVADNMVTGEVGDPIGNTCLDGGNITAEP
jgi:parallel beta-helix repeat protein